MDDLISRQEVLENAFAIYTHECGLVEVVGAATIKELPSVNPQERTGYWIRFKEFENGYYHIKCSECGQYWSIDGHAKIFKYCFNCGAKMEVEQNG